ncbi:MAG: hypothetical protein V5A55_11615 [Halovenus sp.]
MTDSSADPDTAQLLAELTQTLRELEQDVEPERRLRPPTPGELSRFTSEVAIPGLILVLRTNIRVLELLRRTLRLADGRQPTEGSGAATQVRNRAEQLGNASLSRLDDVLTELQSTLSAREGDEEVEALLARARELQTELEAELAAGETTASEPVGIDVEAELRALKDNVEDDSDGDNDSEPPA